MSYFSDLVAVPQRVLPDTETAEDTVHTDLEFLDDPDRAEEDAVPRVMYKPNSDEEEAAYVVIVLGTAVAVLVMAALILVLA